MKTKTLLACLTLALLGAGLTCVGGLASEPAAAATPDEASLLLP